MSIDLMEAVQAPFKKTPKMNIVHYIIGVILAIIPIVNFIIMGGMLKYAEYVRKGREQEFYLFDDIVDNLKVGLKMFAGSILLCLPVFLIGVVGGMFSDGKAGSLIMFVVLLLLVCLVYIAFGFALIANFSLDKKIMSMVDFQRALFLIKGDTKSYIMTIVYTLVLSFALGLISVVPLIGIVVQLVMTVPFGMATYHLIGQFLKNNKAVPVLNNVFHFDN